MLSGVANSTSDSRISMDVVTYLREDSSVTDGTPHNLEVTIDDGTKQTMDIAQFTVKATRDSISVSKNCSGQLNFVSIPGYPPTLSIPNHLFSLFLLLLYHYIILLLSYHTYMACIYFTCIP